MVISTYNYTNVNAAQNIKALAVAEINRVGTTRIYACGDASGGDVVMTTSSHASMKHENQNALAFRSLVL